MTRQRWAWPAWAVVALLTGCALDDGLTPLAAGRVVVVNGSLSEMTSATITPCRAIRPAFKEQVSILPGERWITELAGGCYRITATAGGRAFVTKPFDLPPSGSYRVTLRTAPEPI